MVSESLVKLAAGVAVALAAAFGVAAQAATYSFTISGSGFTGAGSLTDDESIAYANLYPCAACAAGPGYLVTSIVGTLNGMPIAGLAPLNAIAGNNNRIYPTTTPALDWGDLGFVVAGSNYNVFDAHWYNDTGFFLAAEGQPLFHNPVAFTLTAAGVPEPATWALLTGGFAAVGMALRRRAVAA